MSSDYASGPRFTPWDHDHPADGEAVIRTRSGNWLDLVNPNPDGIVLEDIAYGLAHIARFGGQTPSFYSVAEHSLGVAAMLLRQYGDHELTRFGLMHDAAEAFLGDMVSPLKRHVTRFRHIEDRMMETIGQAFGFPDAWHDDPRIKAADEAMLVFEMANVRGCPHREPVATAKIARRFLAVFEGHY